MLSIELEHALGQKLCDMKTPPLSRKAHEISREELDRINAEHWEALEFKQTNGLKQNAPGSLPGLLRGRVPSPSRC